MECNSVFPDVWRIVSNSGSMKWLVGSPELGLESQLAVQLGPVPPKPLQEKAGDRSMHEGYFLHLKFSADQEEQLRRLNE